MTFWRSLMCFRSASPCVSSKWYSSTNCHEFHHTIGHNQGFDCNHVFHGVFFSIQLSDLTRFIWEYSLHESHLMQWEGASASIIMITGTGYRTTAICTTGMGSLECEGSNQPDSEIEEITLFCEVQHVMPTISESAVNWLTENKRPKCTLLTQLFSALGMCSCTHTINSFKTVLFLLWMRSC